MIFSRVKKVFSSEVIPFNSCKSLNIQYLGFSEVLNDDYPCIRSHFFSHVYLVDLDDPTLTNNIASNDYIIQNSIPECLIQNHLRYVPLLRKCLLDDVLIPSQYYDIPCQ